MKVTVITSTYNCIDELDITISSFRENKRSNIEWIIVDGNSTDGTVSLIEQNSDIVTKYISEDDSGIYDAWNKACALASGDWIIFLGAGDRFINSSLSPFLSQLELIDPAKHRIVYGNVELVDKNGRLLHTYTKYDESSWECGRPSLPCHQGVFQHRSLFDSECVFDTRYKIAADSKFLFNAMKETSVYYIDVDISCMQMFGVSTNPSDILKVVAELKVLRNELGITMPIASYLSFHCKAYIKHFLSVYCGYSVFSKVAKLYTQIKKKDHLY
ncbi:MAG: glycosyltransferase [Aliivibrio sp.]|uniref:glycosyltransferase family 2 protein n=1 Tax=Aliivibrio sp. TaxID=1872443 RepID=UPI001A3660D6|nr:glycosyltransferase [Aliivibrio sp.]